MATKHVSKAATGAPVPTKAAAPAVKKKKEVKRPKLKIPKSFGACADLLYTIKDERLAIQREAKVLETDEKALKNHLIEQLPKGELGGAQGKIARATIVTQDIPRIEDEAKLMAAIKKSPKKWGTLLKTVVDFALLAEILENDGAKGLPPGVGVFTVKKVSLNKV